MNYLILTNMIIINMFQKSEVDLSIAPLQLEPMHMNLLVENETET